MGLYRKRIITILSEYVFILENRQYNVLAKELNICFGHYYRHLSGIVELLNITIETAIIMLLTEVNERRHVICIFLI